jgi:hypothetical protein
MRQEMPKDSKERKRSIHKTTHRGVLIRVNCLNGGDILEICSNITNYCVIKLLVTFLSHNLVIL